MNDQKQVRRALLVGRTHQLMWAMPQLLSRAGFSVDVVTFAKIMKKSKFVRNCTLVSSYPSLIASLQEHLRNQYDWIIVNEDEPLAVIKHSELSEEDKLKVLPVLSKDDFVHLYSKIGLSNIFEARGVNTPPFFVVTHLDEAVIRAEELGYPVFIKVDSSGGGRGIFECKDTSDLRRIPNQIFLEPVLLQKKLLGVELDLSALYLEGNLVHFNYAVVEKTMSPFGPSSLRTFKALSSIEEAIFKELNHIGKALGAHGFTNISCMETSEGRFYFEVDMRPNAWIEFPRYYGEDPAERIAKWFAYKEKLIYPVDLIPAKPASLRLPYFLRLKRWELFCNRYGVWKYIPKDDGKLVIRLILEELFQINIKHYFFLLIKLVTPEKCHDKLRVFKRLIEAKFPRRLGAKI